MIAAEMHRKLKVAVYKSSFRLDSVFEYEFVFQANGNLPNQRAESRSANKCYNNRKRNQNSVQAFGNAKAPPQQRRTESADENYYDQPNY